VSLTWIIARNIIGGLADIVGVVAPLAWAIRTQQHNEPVAAAVARPARASSGRAEAAARRQRPAYEAG